MSKNPQVKTLHAYSRKELPISEKLKGIVSTDSSSWPKQYPSGVDLFISGLATTRNVAGSFENQKKIDYDLNLELAKAAKEAGTKSYVLISSQGANSSSMFAYMKMKGQLEDAVQALGFDHVVLVRPGMIVGQRTHGSAGYAESAIKNLANCAGSLSNRLKDPWAQDAETIAKAAVRAGLDCVEGKEKEKVRILNQSDIVRLGRTEWKD